MPTDRSAHSARRRGPAAVALLLSIFVLLGLSGCTRDDVAAAVSTFAAQIRTTLAPLGATAQAQAARLPDALATAKGPAPTATANTLLLAAGTAFAPPTATATATPASTATPQVTATPPPTATPAATATPQPSPTPLPFVLTYDGGEMALVPGGFFQMGAAADDLLAACETVAADCRRDWFLSSAPAHAVLLAPFYMDVHEVTNEAYIRFLNSVGGTAALCAEQPCLDESESQIVSQEGLYGVSGDLMRRPVAGVTWYGAAAFCEWRGARLPSEAEWEKAAAWDDATVTARRWPWGNEFNGQRLNFCDANCNAPQANLAYNDGFGKTAIVGSYEEGLSPTGLHDMAGNLWEWVADWYDPTYYTTAPGTDPAGPESGEQKVVRGGSWYDTATFTMPAVRLPSPPGNADATLGFRCAVDVPQ